MSVLRSTYLTDEENSALVELSKQTRTSINAITRVALRQLLGLPVPYWGRDLTREEENVHA